MHFTQDDRNEISILLKKGYSQRDIASVIKKNHSSVSREIKRNTVNGIYDAHKAGHKAYVRRKYSKYHGMKIRKNPILERYVQAKLKQNWTPEQIAGRLAYENNGQTVISTRIIYKYLYSPFGQLYCKYLPSQRYKQRKRHRKKVKRQIIKDRVFIDKRPEVINKRERFGDLEGDVLGHIKSDTNSVAGLVERSSRYLLISKISRPKYAMKAFKKLISPYRDKIHSITLDNGSENASYKSLQIDTYFCNPYSSWEKGQIENSFQRLRRFIPKKSPLSNLSARNIAKIARLMNHTPRKCLGFRTPSEVFNEQLSSSSP